MTSDVNAKSLSRFDLIPMGLRDRRPANPVVHLGVQFENQKIKKPTTRRGLSALQRVSSNPGRTAQPSR